MKGGRERSSALALVDAMADVSDLSQMLDRVHEVLPRYASFEHGVLCVTRPELHGGYDWRAPGLPAGWFGRYSEMAEHDFVRASVLRAPNEVLRDDEMISRSAFRRSVLYERAHELGLGIERVMSVSLVDPSADWHGGLTLYRATNRPFSDRERDALQAMVPVLRSSMSLLRRCLLLQERVLARDALCAHARMEAIFFRHCAIEDDRTLGASDLLRAYYSADELGRHVLPAELVERLRALWIASPPASWGAPLVRERGCRTLRVSFVPLSPTLIDWRWAIVLEETSSEVEVPERWVGMLTAREREVVALALQEHDNAFIADSLGCKLATVKKHLQHAFDKLGVDNRRLLLHQARRQR